MPPSDRSRDPDPPARTPGRAAVPVSRRAGLATVAVGLLLVALVGLGGGGAGAFLPAADGVDDDSAGTPTLTPVPNVSVASTDRAGAGAADRDRREFPPGLSRSGIDDAAALASAHESQVAGQSHRVAVLYQEYVNGTAAGSVVQRVAVENATTYRGTRVEVGDVAGTPPLLTEGEVYANGSARVVRTDDGSRQESLVDDALYVTRVERYHRWYLSVTESRVIDRTTDGDRRLTQVRYEADPYRGAHDIRGSAIVDDDGVVVLVRRSYVDAQTGRRTVVTVRVSNVGQTNVTRPEWVSDSGSADGAAESVAGPGSLDARPQPSSAADGSAGPSPGESS